MKVALSLSLLMVGSFLVGFYVLSPFFPMEKIPDPEITKNQSMTDNSVKNWGYTNDYCLKKLRLKDTSIILIPRCQV